MSSDFVIIFSIQEKDLRCHEAPYPKVDIKLLVHVYWKEM